MSNFEPVGFVPGEGFTVAQVDDYGYEEGFFFGLSFDECAAMCGADGLNAMHRNALAYAFAKTLR